MLLVLLRTINSRKEDPATMEAISESRKIVPKPIQWAFSQPWYLWLGWFMEAAILFVFLSVMYTQFAQDEARAGWVMLLLTVVFAGPGIWILLRYRPESGSKFGKYDIGLIICFAIWIALFGYTLLWDVQFYPGPFGSPHVPGVTQ
jgi:hypothetical protein